MEAPPDACSKAALTPEARFEILEAQAKDLAEKATEMLKTGERPAVLELVSGKILLAAAPGKIGMQIPDPSGTWPDLYPEGVSIFHPEHWALIEKIVDWVDPAILHIALPPSNSARMRQFCAFAGLTWLTGLMRDRNSQDGCWHNYSGEFPILV